MLRTVAARHDRFGLKSPFRIARGVKTDADVVTVEIAVAGLTGRGEGVPYPRYGETIEAALADIAAVTPALAQGAGREELLVLMPAGAARNAVDGALWDLDAQLARTTVGMLLGQPPLVPVETAVTIGIDTPEAMHRAAIALGSVPLVKVKVDDQLVAERIAAVRSALPDARMIVDPNESWSMDLVEAIQPVLADAQVGLLEQPLPADADAALAGFVPLVPICADESAHGIADLDRLQGRYAYVNIKLDKTGGLTAALAFADAAQAAGFELMLGCMVCSSLGIAPALALASRAGFVDCDGPWWLAQDRGGGVRIEGGMLHPPAPGFWGGV
ncbi:L-Ala-D/L-Glu epimerase [Sphingomonas sp. S1-29]|uniref:N-acetyl-D-Glu racemase DgcA n=1 Tax=Sphingomonas sp. S1-29 TaxID=2991074 RepID=UPI00223F94BD|nr:N-acetyl-D-Glu racemase DgcA [Sphingomonas sp. S1-29]UZK68269.1 L-Ala-D/L-Glu epimerase [Sphingomonas sp. S1-29]